MDNKINLVVKENKLINASYRLDLVEQRLMLMTIVEARKKGITISNREHIKIHASNYAEQFNTTQENAYLVLKEAASSLVDRSVSWQEFDKLGPIVVKSNWVQQISYQRTTGIIKILLTEAVVSLVTELEKQFTAYDIEQVSAINSSYAVRLYELIISWRSVGKTPVIALFDLRNKLGINDDKFLQMCHFKSKVLDFSVDEINKKTDIKISYDQIKEGRKIVGFVFKIENEKIVKSSNKRKKISRLEAEQMAKIGESWPALLARIGKEYIITDL
jgi:plasmid replication initiation protein